MHILLGLITTLAGLAWALYRLQNAGINLNSFNPFFWIRRRKWEQQLGTKPIHQLDNTIDAASVLMVTIAKMDGEITREQKTEIISLFENEFGLSHSDAIESYASSSYMLQDEVNIIAEVKNILEPNKTLFKPHQSESLLKMLNTLASNEGVQTKEQKDFIVEVVKQLHIDSKSARTW